MRQAGGRDARTIEARRRVSTGIRGLDSVLRGGIPQYAVVVVAGPPGSGKTILSQQVLFHNATSEHPCVYLTTLSESPMKAARYQSQFSFFDPAKFGTSIIFMDVGQIIRARGLAKSLDVITDALRAAQPAVVVIDSFKAIHDLAPSPRDMRTFIYDLSIELAAMQTTSLLVGEYSESDFATQPEFAIADGIIWLYSETRSQQLSRYVRVLKMRGVDFNTAAHSFEISRAGIEVFSVEGLIPTEVAPYRDELTKTGLTELDDLLRGGIPRGAPLLVTGGAGSGKTTLCLQYLYEGAVRYGEKGIYFSYEEPVDQIVANARGFGWDFRELVDRGMIQLHHTPLPRINPSEQLLLIRHAVKSFGARRAAIDSLTMMMTRIDDHDLIRGYVYNLTAILKEAGCTAFVTSDPPVGSAAISRFGVEESIIDGVILLRVGHEGRARARYLEVYKVRGVNHATGDNVMKITPRGVQIFPRVEEVL